MIWFWATILFKLLLIGNKPALLTSWFKIALNNQAASYLLVTWYEADRLPPHWLQTKRDESTTLFVILLI